jgi:hypothetical protein
MSGQEGKHVHQHVEQVKRRLRETTMLKDIEEAHQPYTFNTEDNTSATIDSSFFFHVEGQPSQRELTSIQQETDEQLEDEQESGAESGTEDSENDRSDESQSERSENGDNYQSQSDEEPPYNSDSSGDEFS